MAYNSKVVHKVLSDFENKYKSAVANAEKKKKELYEKIPEFWDIDKKLSGTYKEIAETMLSPGSDITLKINGLKKKNQDLCKKRKLLLKKSGYPENYTEPVYNCPICEDSGYNNEVMCVCLKKALADESLNYSGFGKIVQKQTFENFKYSDSDKYLKTIYDDCKDFSRSFDKEFSRNLMFIGSAGLGKTHLSSAIAREVIDKGFDVFYDSAQSILYSFEKERFSRSGTFDPDIIERYMTCDLLIIDDLGTEYSGNMSVSSLYNLINMRLINNKSMIISTNLTIEEIKKRYDERIVSRIFGMFTILNFIGEDVRLKKL